MPKRDRRVVRAPGRGHLRGRGWGRRGEADATHLCRCLSSVQVPGDVADLPPSQRVAPGRGQEGHLSTEMGVTSELDAAASLLCGASPCESHCAPSSHTSENVCLGRSMPAACLTAPLKLSL